MKRLFRAAICAIISAVAVLIAFNIADRIFSEKEFTAGNYSYYHYLTLNETEKQAYTAVKEKIYKFPKNIETPVLTEAQLEKVLNALIYDDPMMFMYSNCTLTTKGSRAFFTPDYCMSKDEYTFYKNEINKTANRIKNAISSKSDFDKELFCHDYIIENCEYSNTGDELENTVAGVFINGKAKCTGYAKALKLLLNVAGVDAELVTGTATDHKGNSQSHMWNAVKLDGSWCYTDPTWDDPLTDNGSEICRHVYFNMTEEMIRRTHSEFLFSQTCNTPSLYYYIIYGVYFDTCDDNFVSDVSDLIAQAAITEKNKVEFMLSSDEVMSQAFKTLFEKQKIYRALETAALKTNVSIITDSVKYSTDYDENLITIIFETEG